MTQKSEVMTLYLQDTVSWPPEGAFLRISVIKEQLTHWPKLLYICDGAAAGERSYYLSTPSPASPTRGAHCRTATMSSNICPCRLSLLIFVLSLLALLYRSSFVAARPPCAPGSGKYWGQKVFCIVQYAWNYLWKYFYFMDQSHLRTRSKNSAYCEDWSS